jgi:hypothetical protein
MACKKKDIIICHQYSKDLKMWVIYQSTNLGKSSTKIAKSLDMNFWVLQRVLHTWKEISEVCQDRTCAGSGGLCNVNPLIFRANRYVLWGELKNLVFEDEKGIFLRNNFGTAKSCNAALSCADSNGEGRHSKGGAGCNG